MRNRQQWTATMSDGVPFTTLISDGDQHGITLGYLPHQDAVRKLPTMVKALVGGYGSGKSRFICQRALEFCYSNPGLYGAIVSPSISQAEKTIIPTLIEICDEHGIPYRNYGGRTPRFEIFGATLWILSGHKPAALKGPNLGWCAIDEPFIQSVEVYRIMISRIRDRRSTMREVVLAGTPEQLNWGYRLLVKNKSEKVGWVRASSKANPYLPPDHIALMEDQYDEQMLAAYRDGSFVIVNTLAAYYSFSDDNVRRACVYSPSLPLVLTCDFNKSPMCWNIIQDHTYTVTTPAGARRTATEPWVIDEIHVNSTDTYQCLNVLDRRWGQKHTGHVYITGDFAGDSVRSTTASVSDYEAIIDRCQAIWGPQNVHKRLMPNPLVRQRVNAVNAKLKNARGDRHLFINPKCEHTIEDFRLVQIKEGTDEIDKSAKFAHLTHHSDAVGYHVYEASLRDKARNLGTIRRA